MADFLYVNSLGYSMKSQCHLVTKNSNPLEIKIISVYISILRLKEKKLICVLKKLHVLSLELVLKKWSLLMTQNHHYEY